MQSQMSASRLFAAYLGDMKFEFTKMLRTPAFALPTLLFPAMFYLLFGVLMGSAKGNADAALYSFAGMSVFGTMAPGLFGFGVSLAFEREYGLLTFKQALPMPPGAYLIARMAMAMLFASIISLLLILLAKFVGHVPLTFGKALTIYLVNVLGVLPFCAIGLCVGAYVSGQAAPAIVNVIYLPMAFLSGLWFPMQFLPHIVQQMAPAWPAYHLAQLSFGALDAPSMGSTASHVTMLTGITIVFFTIAVRKLANGGLRMFGGSGSPGGSRVMPFISRGILVLGIGLIISGAMGGHARVDPAAGTPADAATNAGVPAATAPIGIAAPAIADLSNFDNGSAAAAFGGGWQAFGDADRGGDSTGTQRVVDGGADKTSHALEVSGTVGTAIQYPFAGTGWQPGSGQFMDLSAKQSLTFQARGDGRTYTVAIISGLLVDAIPAMYQFTAGPEWQKISVPLQEMAGVDIQRIKTIAIGTGSPAGDFRFQIDNVRLE